MLHQDIQILVLLLYLRVESLLDLQALRLLNLQLFTTQALLRVLLFMVLVALFFLLNRLIQKVALVTFPSDLNDAECDKDGQGHENAIERHKDVVEV